MLLPFTTAPLNWPWPLNKAKGFPGGGAATSHAVCSDKAPETAPPATAEHPDKAPAVGPATHWRRPGR